MFHLTTPHLPAERETMDEDHREAVARKSIRDVYAVDEPLHGMVITQSSFWPYPTVQELVDSVKPIIKWLSKKGDRERMLDATNYGSQNSENQLLLLGFLCSFLLCRHFSFNGRVRYLDI
jgi:hypothetical protein